MAARLRWAAPKSPLEPSRPSRVVGRFRDGIWNWRGFRLPIPAPTDPAEGKELDWPKPRLEKQKQKPQDRKTTTKTNQISGLTTVQLVFAEQLLTNCAPSAAGIGEKTETSNQYHEARVMDT